MNPRQVRDFARATGQLAKTDSIDAAVLALFAERIRPEVRPLKDAEALELEALVVRRRQVVDTITAEKNRLLPRLPPNEFGPPSAERLNGFRSSSTTTTGTLIPQ